MSHFNQFNYWWVSNIFGKIIEEIPIVWIIYVGGTRWSDENSPSFYVVTVSIELKNPYENSEGNRSILARVMVLAN